MKLFYEADLRLLDEHYHYKRRENRNLAVSVFLTVTFFTFIVTVVRTVKHQKADT